MNFQEEKPKLRQELRDLIIRNFQFRNHLAISEVKELLREIPELAEVQKAEMSEKEREKVRCELRKAGNEFLRAVKEKVDCCVFLCDIEGLTDLAKAVDVISGYHVIKIIREKGFSKEFTEFCDKVGRGKP